MIEASEALVADLVRDRVGSRLRAGSYVFDPDLLQGVLIKWEGDSDVVHGIEPFAHLSPELDRWAHDERFVDPMRAMVDDPAPTSTCSARTSSTRRPTPTSTRSPSR